MDVKTLCLGVLSMGEASGYEIRKVFEAAFSHFYVAGFGSIYPALAALAEEGYVSCSDVEQSKRPAKKVYRITPSGLACFRQALASSYPHHRIRSDFMVLTVFAHMQTPERMSEVLEQRIEEIERQLAQIDSDREAPMANRPGVAFTAGYARCVLEAGREYIRQHRNELLQSLSAQEVKP